MRIFITGSTGFIGRNLLPLLDQENDELLLLVRDEKNNEFSKEYKANIIIGDLTEIVKFKNDIRSFNPQACIHLAWEGIPDYSFDMSKRNIDNSLELINLILNETNCKKILISGSCYEYGKTAGICKESNKANITSAFSWAKYALYKYYQYVCKKSKVDLIWFRIFYVYGPKQRKESLIPMLVGSLKSGAIPQINNPLNANDFIYVKDIVEAFRTALHIKLKSGIYNLGSGKSTRVVDVCEIVEKLLFGKTDIAKRIKNNANKQTINFCADMSKTKKALGWAPRTSLYDGIAQHIESFKKL